ncbi:hypothetical protein FRB95_007906 [Tulasnella sp. JGI-2019a]|nr:hypothetical protein FRB95_007906 [Tulasnella sp. JGI-2019a]
MPSIEMEDVKAVFLKAAMSSRRLGLMDRTTADLQTAETLCCEMFRGRFPTQQMTASHQRGRNAYVPINRLPSGILSHTFKLSVEDYYTTAYYFERLREISFVSAGWYALVSDSPALWAVADSDQSIATLEKALLSSKDCPLRVNASREYGLERESGNLLPS